MANHKRNKTSSLLINLLQSYNAETQDERDEAYHRAKSQQEV